MKRQLSVASAMSLLLWLAVSAAAYADAPTTVSSTNRGGDSLVQQLGSGTLVLDTSKNPLHQLFSDSHLVKSVGYRRNGACTSNSTPLRLVAGEAPVALLVVAANLRTCQQVLEVGHLRSAPTLAGGSSAVSTTAAASRLGPAVATGGTQPAHFITIWYDPANFPVNHVEDIIYWSYGGGHVSNCRGSDYRWWLSDTGWRETAHSGPYLAYEHTSTDCRLYTSATYYNVPFCGGTGIGYNANNVYGQSDGSAWGWVNTWAWGCRANWLWYGTYLEWG